jgi:hypothetical protein
MPHLRVSLVFLVYIETSQFSQPNHIFSGSRSSRSFTLETMSAVPCNLLKATIQDLQRLLGERKCTSVDLIEAYLVSEREHKSLRITRPRNKSSTWDGNTDADQQSTFLQAAIEKDNHQGLQLHAVIETGPRKQLLKIAQALDEQRQSGVWASSSVIRLT